LSPRGAHRRRHRGQQLRAIVHGATAAGRRRHDFADDHQLRPRSCKLTGRSMVLRAAGACLILIAAATVARAAAPASDDIDDPKMARRLKSRTTMVAPADTT